LLQELIVGDLMKDFKLTLDQVLQMGYYEAHRLWLVSDEMRFREIQHLSLVMDYVHSPEDRRREFLEWIQSKQPRRYSGSNDIPVEVLEKYAEAFNNG